jgi:predicted dehydrogenase
MKFNRRETLKAIGQVSLCALGVGTIEAARGASPAPIKIGQIGVGHAHASKLSVYRSSADYEVVGMVESDPVLREQAKSQEVYRDLPWMTQEQLLNVSGLQVVLVETKVNDLLDTAEACVQAGKHIHLDKPAGDSLSQFERVLKFAEQQKLLVQMGYMYRYNPAVVLLRQFLKQGWLGDIFEAHAVMSKVVSGSDRKNLAEFRGGMMFELGCHILDLVVGVLGEPKQVSAHSQHASAIQDGLADNTLAVLSYPRALATIKSSAMEVDGSARRHLVVCGTEGTFHIQPLDNPSARVSLSSARDKYKKGTHELTFPKYVRYVDDAADMARILRGEKPSDFSYQHDLAVQRTLLKACGLL